MIYEHPLFVYLKPKMYSRKFFNWEYHKAAALLTPSQQALLQRIQALPLQRTTWTRTPILPPISPSNRKLLVLDLDETLGTGYEENYKKQKNKIEGFKYFRPHLSPFLDCCFSLFDVVVWTRSGLPYSLHKCVHPNLNMHKRLNMTREEFQRNRLLSGFSNCLAIFGSGAKDLIRLGRPMDQVLLIDDDPCHLHGQVRQQVLIKGFVEYKPDMEDTQLKDMIPFLERVAAAPTVQHELDVLIAVSDTTGEYVEDLEGFT
eukprot:PhF_6_TR41670/c1_g1_i5/m.63180/K15731/CTDSP; carboxy-terminal domain RNA polymerase II polypeptide A small phosphatase